MTPLAKPPFPWVGGKEKLLHIIYQVFPPDISRLVEHCGGSGSVILGLPKVPRRLDIYNDYNTDLANLFLCIRDRPLALLRELSYLSFMSEAEFDYLKRMLNQEVFAPDFTEDELLIAEEYFTPDQYAELRQIIAAKARLWDVRRAAAFYRVSRYSYSGTMRSFGVRKVSLKGFFHLIRAASERLDGVPITNRDCCDSIELNNKPNTLHYCDPPYYKAEDKYQISFSKGDHQRLHDALKECVGYVVVSYNFCPEVVALYADFFILHFERKNDLAREAGAVYEEVLITNFDPRPVIEYNRAQIDLLAAQDKSLEKGKLVLIHQP